MGGGSSFLEGNRTADKHSAAKPQPKTEKTLDH
jgi:hypothetical protein